MFYLIAGERKKMSACFYFILMNEVYKYGGPGCSNEYLVQVAFRNMPCICQENIIVIVSMGI